MKRFLALETVIASGDKNEHRCVRGQLISSYMAGATSREMEHSDWLRRCDWQSLLSRNAPVHYGIWFASANV